MHNPKCEQERLFFDWFTQQRNKGGVNHLIIKSIRADIADFSNIFVPGIFQEFYLSEGKELADIRVPLRRPLTQQDQYKVKGKGVCKVGKDKQYKSKIKGNKSKKQSVTSASPKQDYWPPVFGIGTSRENTLTGIIFASDKFEQDDHFLSGGYPLIYDVGTATLE
jgi:hypothetical protein